jgi:ABC-2 type transport system permease protein
LSFRFDAPRAHVILALIRRDYALTRSYRYTLVFDLFFGIVNLMIYFYISRTFHGAETPALDGAPTYFDFAAVGIAITVVVEAASTSLADRVRQEQLTGTLEALAAQPLSSTEMSFGMAGFGFFYAMLRAAFYLLVAVAFLGLDASHTSWIGFVAVLVTAGAALSAIGVVLGAVALVFKRGHVLAGVVTFGMALLTGAFFPVSVLPGWLQGIGSVIPTRFAFDGLRAAMFSGSDWAADVAALMVFTVVALPIAAWIFSRAMLLARGAGSLSQY